MFQIKFVEEIKIHILYPVTFSQNRAIYEENVEKYGGAREAVQYGACALYAGKLRLHRLSICISCFCTATMVTPTRLDVT